MLLTEKNKLVLRRLKGERSLTYKALAQSVGIHDNTIRRILRNDESEEIQTTTYMKIMQFIAENY